MNDEDASPTVGVVLMDYGTPAALDEVEEYYSHIRRGRPPSPEELADLVSRYEAIGGTSPLRERSEAQRLAIQDSLDGLVHDRYIVVAGHKHVAPFIEDAVDDLADAGVEAIVGLVLAPHYSAASVGAYQDRAAARASELGIPHLRIDSWHMLPEHLDFLAAAVRDAATSLPDSHHVVFTAHSLPERVLEGDPYPDQLRESASEVAGRLGLDQRAAWSLGWQSAGRTPDPWRGPDIAEVIVELAGTGGCEGLLVCAQGFVSDHLEVLYDLDVLARSVAEEHGIAFARTASLNDEPSVMRGLAGLVHVTAEAGL